MSDDIENANQTLTLDHDYESTNSSSQIVISKSITIDGNNHSISAPDVSRVFLVNASNVSIKNINFINSNLTGLAGGAISWLGDNGSLINCNFINNVASSAGGAVLWEGNNGLIENCSFENNKVNYGPAVSLTDGYSYDPSAIHIQIVQSEGGALYISANNVIVRNCNFINNTASLNGGAISVDWSRNITITSSRFKNNKAEYNGGAIDLSGDNITISNSVFVGNSPDDLFNNCPNTNVVNSIFENENKIDGFYDVNLSNVIFGNVGSFEDLSALVNDTPEGGLLVLDSDYVYIDGQIKGILISKSIIIDGQGHTLDGRHLSRIFNITADNVTIKNVNFKNGNALGRYFGPFLGGGAIYWNGNNGNLVNSNFTDNHGSGLEEDPFDQEEIFIDENGMIIHIIRIRPVGAKLNEGGAITWNGTNGHIDGCIFIKNSVGYPDTGGAIMWRGDNGLVTNSEFYENSAWCGSAICWTGANGTVLSSIIMNNSFFDGGIYWFGANGTVHNTILIGTGYRTALSAPSDMDADYNFWGDTVYDTNVVLKPSVVKNWLVINFTHDGDFVNANDKVLIRYAVENSVDKKGKFAPYENMSFSGSILYTAPKTGYLNVQFVNGEIQIDVNAQIQIESSDLTKYYTAEEIAYKVSLSDITGKLVNETVKIKVNNKVYKVTTDSNGVATLKLKLKPGEYGVTTSYGKYSVKNKITIKKTLVTKNLSKKVNKAAKFKVKVLNSKGKAYPKQLVTIKFKGKTYKIKTNSEGIATLNIPKNLKVGKYTIKTTYNGITNTNKVIVKK
ncbi:right-handed parallel beta-helix repeat-containing protein [Methanobrevibacter sp.]|uniref:right-handed parallel beta-helix repeat-containing protein n=1 Tax=Methanobrevibacter sp. TaxID=66852 RepID=UPI00388D8A08